MSTTLKDLMAAASAVVPRVSAEAVRDLVAREGAVLLDVRDAAEVAASGKLAGAIAVSRGLLEFRADPASPAHLPALRPDVPVVLYCGSGGRAALAGKTLLDLGYARAFNAGGFKELAEAGLATEPA